MRGVLRSAPMFRGCFPNCFVCSFFACLMVAWKFRLFRQFLSLSFEEAFSSIQKKFFHVSTQKQLYAFLSNLLNPSRINLRNIVAFLLFAIILSLFLFQELFILLFHYDIWNISLFLVSILRDTLTINTSTHSFINQAASKVH